MEYRVTFDKLIFHGDYSDKWEYTFSFSVIDSFLIGTPKERECRHKLKLSITGELREDWQLKGVDVVKVAYQGAEDFIKDYIIKQIEKGNSLPKELPPIVMSTVNFSEPYNLSNIKYPEQKFFTVTIHEQDEEETETNIVINRAVFTEKGDIDMGDKHIQGDNIEISGGTVERIETGDKFYDQAQQLIQTVNAQSPQEDIVKVLAAIQEGLTKLELPEAVKEEALNDVKGAEIQVKKEKPDKPKLVERLKNAQDALTGMENLGMKAVAIDNLLVKAIEWAEQLLT